MSYAKLRSHRTHVYGLIVVVPFLFLSSCRSAKRSDDASTCSETQERLAEALAESMVLQCTANLAEIEQRGAELERDNAALRSENTQLQEDNAALGGLKDTNASLQAENEQLTTESQALGAESEALKAQISVCVDELEEARHPGDIRDRLALIPGLGVQEMKTQIDGARVFSVRIEQPLDHKDPSKGYFSQRFVLLHRSEDLPMTLMTTGYGLFGGPDTWVDHEDELTVLTGSNQIVLEHRYFEGSMPTHRDPAEIDWRFLTIEQSAADSHAIVEKLKPIYSGPWVATGRSKGGMTAIFHQRFHPADLAGIVPFVAPISHGINDARYDRWMTQIGPNDGRCRTQIEDLTVELVRRRAELATALRQSSAYFDVFRVEAVEAEVALSANMAWALWQYWGSPELCSSIPRAGTDVTQLGQWVFASPYDILGGSGGSDEPNYDQYLYQLYRELGGPSQSAPYWEAAVADVDFSMLPSRSGPVWASELPAFDRTAMEKVEAFLSNEATHVVAVYGAWDPWSAGRIQVDETRQSRVFIAPAVGHSADLASLSTGDRSRALELLQAMYGRLNFAGAKTTAPSAEQWQHMRESSQWLDRHIQRQEMRDLRRAALSSIGANR
ncbi:MAG: hypothetical protein IPK13_25205 [Deltaproteobacteria bacterium]|nr:hypothetical protein [Deltaproteobacteria bacterium]